MALLPVVASTPNPNIAAESSCNGLDKALRSNRNTEEEYATFTKKHIDGDVSTIGVGDSSHSIDVLSGGESDADTLRKANNNNTLHSPMGSPSARRNAYFAAKELLMTERTYRKDLELVTLWWCGLVSSGAERGALCGEAASALGRPCLALEDVALAQAQLLHDVDAALTHNQHNQSPDNTAEQQVGDILAEHLRENSEAYARLTRSAGSLAARVEAARRRWRAAAEACTAAEAEPRAPLPLHVYLLRPLHRLVYYRQALHALRQAEVGEEPEWERESEMLEELVRAAQEQLSHAENHAVLCQLQRDITGYDTLLVAGRQFVRLGCLLKHSAHGTQQRMCFLFSDLLLYGAKGSGGLQFRVSAHFALHEVRMAVDTQLDTFTLHSCDRSVTFSAPNVWEYSAWCRDLAQCLAHTTQHTQHTLHTQDGAGVEGGAEGEVECLAEGEGGAVHHGNSLLHVCWHRATTLSRQQLHQAMACQLSGYLLRKFKNSHGWQKLWVELAGFCLYFYKAWSDATPLASLPLLGYRVCLPSASDGIHKDFVMKLLFKNHVYFFRAESLYTFQRWMEVISTASAQPEVADRVQ